MRAVRALLFVSIFGVLSAGCSTVVAPTLPGQVIVVGADPAPGGLPGFVVNQGSPGALQNPITCTAVVCYQTIQLRNNGTSCANNVNGQTQVFIAPVSSSSLVRNSSSGLLIPGNPPLLPGQTASVNVTIPEQPSVSYVVIVVLSWTSTSCG